MRDPAVILKEIGKEFVTNRKRGRAEAYSHLQQRIATHLADLVPAVIPLKDAIALLAELDTEFLKARDSTSQSGLEALQQWLAHEPESSPQLQSEAP